MWTPVTKVPIDPDTSARTGQHYQADYFRRKAQAAEAQLVRLQDELGTLKLRLKRIDQLEQKLSLVMGHNTSLLEQVSELSALINSKNQKIVLLEGQLAIQGQGQQNRQSRAVRDRQLAQEQLHHIRSLSQAEIERLKIELSKTLTELREREQVHDSELEMLKRRHEEERISDLTALRRDRDALSEGAGLQIGRLKDLLEQKNDELKDQCHKHMEDVERMGEQIQHLQDNLSKREANKQREIRQLILKHEKQIESRLKQELLAQDVQKRGYEKEIKRLREELAAKCDGIVALDRKLQLFADMSQQEAANYQQEKNRLRAELEAAIQHGLLNIQNERRKEQEIAAHQQAARDKAARQKEALLLAENGKLKEQVDAKNGQIGKMHQQLDNQHRMYLEEARSKDQDIMDLKDRIQRLLVTEEIQAEALKTKLTELSAADVETLLGQLQRQGADLTQQLRFREKQLEQKGERLQKALSDKRALRESYQQLLHNLNNQKQNLSFQLNQLQHESNDSIADLQNRLQLQATQSRNLQQAQQKELAFVSEQKGQLMGVVESKNTEIDMLNSKFVRVKEGYDQETKQLETRLAERQALFLELDNLREKELARLKGQLQRKEKLSQEDKLQLLAKIDQLRKMGELLTKRVEDREKDILLAHAQKQDLAKRLEDADRTTRHERGLLQRQMNQAERNFTQQKQNQKRFLDEAAIQKQAVLQEQLKRGERDRSDLRQMLVQRQQELAHWKDKCNSMQGKMLHLMQNAERLKTIEHKVANLGLDRSILKNVQDILRPSRR